MCKYRRARMHYIDLFHLAMAQGLTLTRKIVPNSPVSQK